MPRCKICKDKFKPKYFNQKVCLEPTCILEWRDKVKEKAWKKEKKVLKESLKTHSDHVKELQVIFNKFIRLRDKDKPCISCCKPAKKENAGHYYSAGGNPELRFNEDNVHLQCEYCNTFLHGNLLNYTDNLVAKIGLCRFTELKKLKDNPMKYSIPELVELKVIYKDKIKQL